jgi:small subunit ribosomal protein S6
MRRYELMLLLRPDLEDDKLQSAVEKVTRAIVNAGGSLSKVSPWGKRRLAYEIQHLRDASYFLIHFDIDPSEVRGIERGLLISEEILRHLVIVLEDRRPGTEDEELVPAVAERQPEAEVEAAEAPSESSIGESVDYESEIAEAPGATEETEAPGEAEPTEQPVAKA